MLHPCFTHTILLWQPAPGCMGELNKAAGSGALQQRAQGTPLPTAFSNLRQICHSAGHTQRLAVS